MPGLDAVRFELAVYVAPDRVDRLRELLAATDDNCVLLDIERVIGAHLEGDRLALIHGGFDYAEGVAEVYSEGETNKYIFDPESRST